MNQELIKKMKVIMKQQEEISVSLDNAFNSINGIINQKKAEVKDPKKKKALDDLNTKIKNNNVTFADINAFKRIVNAD